MTKLLAERLASFALQLRYEDLPAKVVHEVKRRILDSLACAVGAFQAEPCRIARRVAQASGRASGSTVLGTRQKTSADLAAFANGAMVRYLDYNDTYLSKEPCHPSDNIPAALACAEAAGANGRQLIAAIVVSYEVVSRLCDAACLRRRGWDHVTYGPFSSALAAAKLFGLNMAQTQEAVALAGVANVALRQTRVGELSDWKGLAFANAARNGVFAAMLAKEGLKGPSEIFEGRLGFWNQVSGSFRLELPRPGGPYKILESSIKFFPAEYHAQSAVEAALKLKSRISDPASIRRITIDSFEASVSIIGGEKEKWHPTSRETADHSLPYMTAAALLDGELTLRQFTESKLRDRSLARLVQKVRVRENKAFTRAYPELIPNRVTVVLGSGKKISETVSAPRGHAQNPMTDGEVLAKFQELAQGSLAPEQMERTADLVWGLEKLKEPGKILEALVVNP